MWKRQAKKKIFLNKLKSNHASIMAQNENSVARTLLFGRPDFNYSTNKEIINATISFISITDNSTVYFFSYIFFHFSLIF